MRLATEIERYRLQRPGYESPQGADFGAFRIPGPHGRDLIVIASSGDPSLGVDWEHVSVSTRGRCPNWIEMCLVKSLFWGEEETVMQLHVPKSRWINNHPFCLHMWRPTKQEIPLPPDITVGLKELNLPSEK